MIRERIMALGGWDVQLTEDAPLELLAKVPRLAHVVITPSRIDPASMADADVLQTARYVGVYTARPSVFAFQGWSNSWWLGDAAGIGRRYPSSNVVTRWLSLAHIVYRHLDQWSGLRPGTLRGSGPFYWSFRERAESAPDKRLTSRQVLDALCGYTADEWQVTNDFYVNVSYPDYLYPAAFKTLLVGQGATRLRPNDLVHLAAMGVNSDMESYANRVWNAQRVTTGIGSDSPVPIYDFYTSPDPLANRWTISDGLRSPLGGPVLREQGVTPNNSALDGVTYDDATGQALLLADLAQQVTTARQLRFGATINLAAYTTRGVVRVGEWVGVSDPLRGLFSPDSAWIEDVGKPIGLRVIAHDWALKQGMGVYFRTPPEQDHTPPTRVLHADGFLYDLPTSSLKAAAEYIDVTDWVAWEDGSADSIEVGAERRTIGSRQRSYGTRIVPDDYTTATGAPIITVQPRSQHVQPGSTVTLTSAASATATPTLQWFEVVDEVATAISGATTGTLTVDPISAGTHEYFMRATNAYGSVDSEHAIVTAATFHIVTQPQSLWAGQNSVVDPMTFEVAGGSTPIGYTWFVGASGDTGTQATSDHGSGFATASFTPSTATVGTRLFWCRATDTTGAQLLSNAASLTVTDLHFTQQPVDGVYAYGVTIAPREVLVEGGRRPYTYQWYVGTAPDDSVPADATYGSGFTSRAFVPLSTHVGTRRFWCRVLDAQGVSAASRTCVVTVGESTLAITNPTPATQTVPVGSTAEPFVVRASGGTPPYTYRWWRGVSGEAYDPAHSGSGYLTTEYTPPTDAVGSETFWCRVTDSVGFYRDSNAARFTVGSDTLRFSMSIFETRALNQQEPIYVSEVTGGTSPYSYRWYVGSVGDTSTPCTSTHGSGYTTHDFTPATTTAGTFHFWLRVTDSTTPTALHVDHGCDIEVTSTVSQFQITTQPASQVVDTGGTSQLSITVSGGTPNYTYTWYSGAVGTTTTVVSGPTTGAATTNVTGALGAGSYWCRVADSSSPVRTLNSVAATITEQTTGGGDGGNGVGGILKVSGFMSGPGDDMDYASRPTAADATVIGTNFDWIFCKTYHHDTANMAAIRAAATARGGECLVLGYVNCCFSQGSERPAAGHGSGGYWPANWYQVIPGGSFEGSDGATHTYADWYQTVEANNFGNWFMNLTDTTSGTVEGITCNGWAAHRAEVARQVCGPGNSLTGNKKIVGGYDGLHFDIANPRTPMARGRHTAVRVSDLAEYDPQPADPTFTAGGFMTEAQHTAHLKSMFQLAKTRADTVNPDALIAGNLLGPSQYFDQGEWDFGTRLALDTAMAESFGRDARNDGLLDFPSKTEAKQCVDMVADSGWRNQRIYSTTKTWVDWLHSTNKTPASAADQEAALKQCRLFYMALFLLGTDGEQFWGMSPGDRRPAKIGDCSWQNQHSIYEPRVKRLGAAAATFVRAVGSPTTRIPDSALPYQVVPAADVTFVSGSDGSSEKTIWRRNFTRGVVLVNPTNNVLSVNLAGGPYSNLDNATPATPNVPNGTYTMQPHTGHVLTIYSDGGTGGGGGVDITSGLMLRYDVTQTAAAATTVTDTTGRGGDGATVGMASGVVKAQGFDGGATSAMTFVRTSSQRVRCHGSVASLQNTQVTISCWVYLTETTSTDDAWEVYELGGRYWLNVQVDTKKVRFGIRQTAWATGWWGYVDTGTALTVNAWHHVAGTYNETTGEMIAYIDGVGTSRTVTPAPIALAPDHDWSCWGAKDSPDAPSASDRTPQKFWQGRMGDLRIYNRPLNLASVQALYAMGTGGGGGGGLSITTQPMSQTIASGSEATLTIGVTGGTGPYTYSWYVGTTVTDTSNLYRSGVGLVTITPAPTVTNSYFCIVTDSSSPQLSVTSQVATVTVGSSGGALTIASGSPADQSVASGGSTTLTVSASGGTGTLHYQWYRGTSGTTTTTVGTDSASYATGALASTTQFWVRVRDSATPTPATADSRTVTVTVTTGGGGGGDLVAMARFVGYMDGDGTLRTDGTGRFSQGLNADPDRARIVDEFERVARIVGCTNVRRPNTSTDAICTFDTCPSYSHRDHRVSLYMMSSGSVVRTDRTDAELRAYLCSVIEGEGGAASGVVWDYGGGTRTDVGGAEDIQAICTRLGIPTTVDSYSGGRKTTTVNGARAQWRSYFADRGTSVWPFVYWSRTPGGAP